MAPSLTLFFIVEPPRYQHLACYLAASIREHLPPEIELVGPVGPATDMARPTQLKPEEVLSWN